MESLCHKMYLLKFSKNSEHSFSQFYGLKVTCQVLKRKHDAKQSWNKAKLHEAEKMFPFIFLVEILELSISYGYSPLADILWKMDGVGYILNVHCMD